MTLHFRDKPGSWERQLKRRLDNPLFPAHKRSVDGEAVRQARALDDEEAWLFQDNFQRLLTEMSQLSPSEETDVILKLKARIDALYEQCAGLHGDRSQEKQALRQLGEVISRTIKTAAAGDPLAEQELQEEQAARELHYQLLEYPVVVDLLRNESPVQEEDLVPTLLSEETDVIRVVMSLFEPEQQQHIEKTAQKLVAQIPEENQVVPKLRAKLDALREPLQ